MGSHRRPAQPGFDRSARVTVLSAAAATAAAALVAGSAHAAPRDTPAETRAEVDRLFAQAEQATEAFNEADERTDRLRTTVAGARDRVARGQERINTMRGALGSLAGAQYRSGAVAPSLELMLSSDPDSYLERVAALDRIGTRQVGELQQLQQAQRTLAQERAEATRALAELERSRADVARRKQVVERKLGAARQLLNSLTRAQRNAYDRASRSGRDTLAPPDAGPAAPSRRAASAVAAVRSAVGRPYVWGANGPTGFDCSGLMQWSYAQAGVGLPRTSQAQRYAGRQVPLSQARPGDLVAYRSDASHIGMYVGNGQVVHAPYPGAPVRYDPVGMMPVSSVTRV
ncbi:NlpC/P60 family protein [Streptomyces sp. NPDC127068]|uniref:C40 family peptidase n=1 Tax=Streptomyces sp. NPDC127068 TaxID=3347127 RepID=UPI0036638F34